MSLRDDLSDNARVILEGLYECGGESNMTEMKQVTGIEESKTILYHAEEYLEPSSFVQYEIVDDGSATGITEFTLTDRGQEAVGSLIESTDDPNLVEQVEEIREAVSEMKREVDTFHGRLDSVEQDRKDSSELTEEIEAVEGDLVDRINRIEAKQDALLGVLWLYDLVDGQRVLELGEQYVNGFKKSSPPYGWSDPFSDGATGGTAGPTLKAIDSQPRTLTTPTDELAEEIEEETDDSESR